MYNTVQNEAIFFLACIVSGALIAFLYDIVRISRRLISVSDPIVNAQDIVFFALAALVLFYTAFTKNSGEVRLQGFLGGAIGVFGYAFLVRNRFVNLGEAVLKWLIKFIIWLLSTVAFPLRIIFRALKKPVVVVAWYTGQALKRARRVAKCQGARAKMRVSAAISMNRKK